MSLKRSSRRFALAGLAATMLGLVLATIVAPAAATASTNKVGYVRLAHLSPDTPNVDVYLDSLTVNMKQQVFKGVGYGVMSGYLTLPVGEYAVSMRASGADPKSPPVLTTDVTVAANRAYTVAGVGRHADLGLRVFHDDLSSPMNGKAKVRIIQASIKDPQLDVSLTNGQTVGTNVGFATTTAYRMVSSGDFSVLVRPSGGGTTTRLNVDLRADSVYSLLILDGKSSLKPDLKTDAASAGNPPAGGVPTGLGGTSSPPLPTIAVSVLALAAVAFGGIAIATRKRSSPRPAAEPALSNRPMAAAARRNADSRRSVAAAARRNADSRRSVAAAARRNAD